MPPRGRSRKVGKTRMHAAVDNLSPMGFSPDSIRTKVKSLLHVYGGDEAWPVIEEASYRLLIESLLEEQDLQKQGLQEGSHIVDGCSEFVPVGTTPRLALTCSACGCHRNFHHPSIVSHNAPRLDDVDTLLIWDFGLGRVFDLWGHLVDSIDHESVILVEDEQEGEGTGAQDGVVAGQFECEPSCTANEHPGSDHQDAALSSPVTVEPVPVPCAENSNPTAEQKSQVEDVVNTTADVAALIDACGRSPPPGFEHVRRRKRRRPCLGWIGPKDDDDFVLLKPYPVQPKERPRSRLSRWDVRATDLGDLMLNV